MLTASPFAAKAIERAMRRRLMEPADQRSPNLAGLACQVKEAFLRQFLGIVDIRRDSQARSIDQSRMPPHKLEKRLRSPAARITVQQQMIADVALRCTDRRFQPAAHLCL